MRLLIAARLSKKADGQTGLESQDAQMKRWAEANGHTVVHVAGDRKSGTTPPWKRPNLKAWVTEPEKIALYDAVAAYRFDRLSRGDKQSTNEIENWAHQHGKQLLTEDGLQFPCEGAEGIRWDVTARIAHEEWLKISERYTRALGYLHDNEFLVGRPPFGYQAVAVPGTEHKRLIPDPVVAPLIREGIKLYLDNGWPLRELCDWLEARGIGTPAGSWQVKTLSRALRNEAMIGRRRGTDKDGKPTGRTVLKMEPILDRATWDRLQKHMDERGTRRGVAPSGTALLTGMVFCDHCKRPMYRHRNSRRQGFRHEYYRCRGDSRQLSTCRNMIPLEELDGWVDARLTASECFVIKTEVIPGSTHQEELDAVERDLRELDYDDPKFLDRQAELLAERTRLRDLPREAARVEQRVMPYTLGDYWNTLDAAGQRAHLLACKVKVYVPRGGEPTMEGDPAAVVI